MSNAKKKAVMLFSGGLDSSTVLAHAQALGFEVYPLSFDYGQRHKAELAAARSICASLGIQQPKVIQLPTDILVSALTKAEIAVPDFDESKKHEIPVTYVPARNTIFLSFALGYAESLGAHDIFLGVSSVDYSGYPDCRPEFIAAFETLANLATKEGVSGLRFNIHAPLSFLSKAETIQLGMKYGLNYALSVSCYRANEDGKACGNCDSCSYRRKGFLEARLEDPTRYQ